MSAYPKEILRVSESIKLKFLQKKVCYTFVRVESTSRSIASHKPTPRTSTRVERESAKCFAGLSARSPNHFSPLKTPQSQAPDGWTTSYMPPMTAGPGKPLGECQAPHVSSLRPLLRLASNSRSQILPTFTAPLCFWYQRRRWKG